MINYRRILICLISGVVITTSASAGMITKSPKNKGIYCSDSDLKHTDTSFISDDLLATGLDLWHDKSLSVAPADVQHDTRMLDQQLLTDGINSISLGLSALMGLGLLGSTHWVKRLHFGVIPEWFHDGGPSQIGHSYAVMPNCLCSTPAYCFIQPVALEEDSYQPQLHRQGVIVSLWRKSQFTPDAIASRGPPYMS
ncbi:MAG: hypothetical protein RQ760_09430 [Sedimentisphaerales bacterium]|nr:hypothetical protein [Sedimentisphaerales bacterium]